MFTALISTDDLAAHINDPDWVIVDCRFDLVDKAWGAEEYAQFHIPGAVYADLEKDICGPVTPTTGRHPLPEPEAFVRTLRRLGIDNTSQVVMYDTTGGGMAARLWFQLKYYGHEKVALLDGSFTKWLAEDRTTREGVETRQIGTFTGKPDSKMVVTTSEAKRLLGSSVNLLIDSRSPERHRGEVEPIDTVAGCIPGSANHFYSDNLDKTGCFLQPQTLKSAFEKVLGNFKPQDAVFYCGSGTTACHNILAMVHAGMATPRLYVGSWSKWIRDPENPVAKG